MAMMDKTKLLSLSSGLVLLAFVVGSHGTKLRVTTVLVRKEIYVVISSVVSSLIVLINLLVRALHDGK